MRKSVKFASNPFADDDRMDGMEEGGFIMVQPEAKGSKKGRGTDGVNTVQGISQEEAQEYLEK